MLEGFFAKLSSYQLASSFIPGAVLIVSLKSLGIMDVGNPDIGESLLLYYISGLVMNRLGALSALKFDDAKLEKLYNMYRDSEQGRLVFDSYVLYRTLAVAMTILAIVIIVSRISDQYLINMASLLPFLVISVVFIFAGATILQLRYLELITARIAAGVSERAE